VAALHDDGPGAQGHDLFGRAVDIGFGLQFEAGQDSSLGQIGGLA